MASGSVSGQLSARLEEAVARVLDNEKWRLEYMMLQVRDQLNIGLGYDKGLQEGFDKGLAEGKAAGFDAGVAEGKAAGFDAGVAEGCATGEERFARLVSALLAANRTDDLTRAATDPALRSSLFEEFGIA